MSLLSEKIEKEIYMTKFKKTILTLSLALVIAFSSLILYACGDSRMFLIRDDVKNQTDAIITNITTNAYNNTALLGTQTDYTVAQMQEKIDNFKYYVEVGTLQNFDTVEKVTVNNTTFEVAEEKNTFALSIGYKNFIKDKVFYVDDNKLFVAAPVIAFETIVGSKIKVNDKEFAFNITPVSQQLAFTAQFQAGSLSTVEAVANKTNEFNVTIKDSNKWLGLYTEGTTATDVYLTKKVLDGQLNGYGLTLAENVANYPLAFYPKYSNAFDYDQMSSALNGKTLEYNIYLVGKGTAKVKLNYTVVNPSAE